MKLDKQKGKKIGIFGLGITGHSLFLALKNIADVIICWDDLEDNRKSFTIEYGENNLFNISDKAWLNLDKIAVSPGIPKSHAIFLLAREYNILISSDIQLFLEENQNSNIICVTGTNGKSTTTSLIGHILHSSSLDWPIGGNIGLPVLSLPKNKDGYVLELSSFQIDLLENFNPYISILLNITPDHLDRHSSFEEYCNAKFKAFKGNGFKIIGTSSKKSKEFFNFLKGTGDKKTISITSNIKHTADIICGRNKILDNGQVYKLPILNNLLGLHNQENIAAAFACCKLLGMQTEKIISSLKTFKGLPHRMQYIGRENNISYYNDSKATNTDSAYYSLIALKNIFWLAGGIFKEENLFRLNKTLKNIKKAYLFGKSKMLFAEYLSGKVEYTICSNMAEAFDKATKDALLIGKKASILLAPACASFDQFENFEDRGNQFIKLYNEK